MTQYKRQKSRVCTHYLLDMGKTTRKRQVKASGQMLCKMEFMFII